MGYREFVDDDGSKWKVWDVKPEPRYTPGRELDAGSSATLADEGPRHVVPGWGNGWLAFQSDEANRRLRPIPRGWETTGEYSLKTYLRHAAAVRQRDSS
jgi:hypothetical protein